MKIYEQQDWLKNPEQPEDGNGDNAHREVVRHEDLSGFRTVAQGDGTGIIGVLMKHVKGDFFAVRDGVVEDVPLGTKFLVDVSSLTRGWCYWRERAVVEPLIHRISENVRMPQRSELSEYKTSQISGRWAKMASRSSHGVPTAAVSFIRSRLIASR